MDAEDAGEESRAVAVDEFLSAMSPILNLEVLQGRVGMDNEIRSPRVQKLGMVLAGFTGYIHTDRVHLFGGSEAHFLRTLDAEERAAAVGRLKRHRVCCVLFTQGLEVPENFLETAAETGTPVLRSAAESSAVIAAITRYLEERLAPRMTVHGVLLEIFGLGVLLLGPSGIGKSECALELIMKGHRLITDDYVEIIRHGMDRLTGTGAKVLKHHMELRGLGIIDIKELFGVSATGTFQTIDLVVRLERWKPDAEYDRLGLDPSTTELLGVRVPCLEMPVAPGRNTATLVEIAARIQLLRQRGHKPFRSAGDD
jgi:HPr kinase/phosphorylase